MLLLGAEYAASLCHASRRLAEGEPAYVEFFKPTVSDGTCDPSRLRALDERLRPAWEKEAPRLRAEARKLSEDPRLKDALRLQRERLQVPLLSRRADVVWAPPGAALGGRWERGAVALTSATLGVLLHELAHANWEISPLREPLERALARRGSDGILAATLLDEGVAGALGPGLIGQTGPWDVDPALDAFAKGLRKLDEETALAAARNLRGLKLRDRFRTAALAGPLAELAARHLDVRHGRIYATAAEAMDRWDVPVVLLIPAGETEVMLSYSPRGRPLLVISGRPEAVASALPEIAGLPAPRVPQPAAGGL